MNLFHILLIMLVTSCSVYAVDYYMYEDITLQKDGSAYVDGETNLDILSIIDIQDDSVAGITQELTNKEGLDWLFKYTTKENLSDFSIKLILPENTLISKVESEAEVGIGIEGKNQVVTFEGSDQPLDIEIQYSFRNGEYKKASPLWILLLILIVFAGFAAWFILWKAKHPKDIIKKVKSKPKKELDEDKIKAIKPTLNDAQIKIVDALLEKKGEASQTTVQYNTGLPKSSLSRNVELMAQKNIISKFYNGTSNYIKIHPSLYKD